jgi:twitching motility two-component system response regulator PilH
VDKTIERDKVLRDIEDAVRRIGRHRTMLEELVTTQTRALLELKDLVARSGGTAPPGTRLPDVDVEIRRTSLARELVGEAAGGARRTIPKVLLVDDDPTTRNLISHFLRKEEFIVEKAANGADGLARAKSGRPDLLIVDAVLPGMDGFELLSHLRKDPETVSIPILMLSTLGEEGAIIKGLEEGADYVIKPFSPQVLVAKIKKILREATDHAVDHRRL